MFNHGKTKYYKNCKRRLAYCERTYHFCAFEMTFRHTESYFRFEKMDQ